MNVFQQYDAEVFERCKRQTTSLLWRPGKSGKGGLTTTGLRQKEARIRAALTQKRGWLCQKGAKRALPKTSGSSRCAETLVCSGKRLFSRIWAVIQDFYTTN